MSNYGTNELFANNTAFNYCYIWDNTDESRDPFAKEGDKSFIVEYGVTTFR